MVFTTFKYYKQRMILKQACDMQFQLNLNLLRKKTKITGAILTTSLVSSRSLAPIQYLQIC